MSRRIRSKALLKAAGLAVFAAMFCIGCSDKSTGGGGDSDTTYYTLTLDADGGEATPESVTATQLPNYNWASVSLPTPTRNGYTFRGWYTEKDGSGYEIRESIIPSMHGIKDFTLYAYWTLAHYTITFDAHGGEVTPAHETTGDGGKLASLPTPTRDAYHDFGGWYTALIDGTGEKIDADHVYATNTTLYAHWIYTGVHHTITFDANGGTVEPLTEETDAGGILQDLPIPERDGHAFVGWFTEKTGGEEVTTSTVFDEAATIYAQWIFITDKMYKVTYNAHGGTVAPAFGAAGEDGKLLTRLPTPKWDGHAFQGWFTEDGAVSAGMVFKNNTTIHAQWAIIHYTITLDATGGTVSPATVTTGSHWELKDELPVPTRDGYTFTGWYTEKTGGTHVLPNSTPLVDIHVIYAHWAEKPPSLVDSRDGKGYKEVVIGEQIWMAENLNYAGEAGKELGVCYNNSADSCAKYGRLYNWYDAMVACPAGWHLPSRDEWTELLEFIGDASMGGKKLLSGSAWYKSGSYDGNGTDDFGFSALPGGFYNYDVDVFTNGGVGSASANFWTASAVREVDAFIMYIYAGGNAHWEYINPKSFGLSVRCLQD